MGGAGRRGDDRQAAPTRLSASRPPRGARRWSWVVLALVALVALLVAWQPSRTTLQTLALIPSLVQLGPEPLALAPEPRHLVVAYTSPDGEVLPADLWLPATASADSPVGAVVVVSGVNSKGRDHPAIPRIAGAVARMGAAVYVPELPIFFQTRVDATEIGRIAAAYQALAARPEIDPERIGIMGVSVGGSLALLAATDPRIADQLDWVAAFGAYADAGEILASVASHQYELNGEIVDWEPTLLVRQVTFALVTEQVTDPDDRAALRAAYQAAYEAGEHPIPDANLELQTLEGRAAEVMLLVDTLEEGRTIVAAAPPDLRDLLDAISPLGSMGEIHARVYLMHDTGDQHIPYAHSRQLAAALEASGGDYRLGEFRLFDHVQPETADPLAAAPEVWKLFWYLREVVADTL